MEKCGVFKSLIFMPIIRFLQPIISGIKLNMVGMSVMTVTSNGYPISSGHQLPGKCKYNSNK